MKLTTSLLRLTLTIIFGLSIILVGNFQLRAQTQLTDPLTLEMLMTGLKSASSGMSLANKNQYIIVRVDKLGVDFPLTPTAEKDLRGAGANDSLIVSIRRRAPKVVDEKKREAARKRRAKREQDIQAYTKAIEENRRDAESYRKRGMLYEYQADYRLALEDYVQTLEINPTDQTTKNHLNRVLRTIGKYIFTPTRKKTDPTSRQSAFVKGMMTTISPSRAAMFLVQPLSGKKATRSKRKMTVNILCFINEGGDVISVTALDPEFSEVRAAKQAAKSSSFYKLKSSYEKKTKDWVIISYEFER
jgi:tetratricopeptide (TPR) repeat protein